jgi:DNA-binding HxlR family transcriptional regulator
MESVLERTEIMAGVLRVASKLAPIIFDNNRLRILIILGTWNEDQTVMAYSQIARLTGISDGATLQHSLVSLMADGLVFNDRNGKYSYYGLTALGASLTRYLVRVLETLMQEKQYKVVVEQELKKHEIDLTDVTQNFDRICQSLEAHPRTNKVVLKPKMRGKM